MGRVDRALAIGALAASSASGVELGRHARVDPALLVAVSLLFGGYLSVAPLPAALGLVGALWLLRPHATRGLLIVSILAFGLGSALARHALNDFEQRRILHRDALGAPRRCVLEGEVSCSPVEREGTTIYSLRATGADCDGERLPLPLEVRLYGGPEDLRRGDRVQVIAQLAAVRPFRNFFVPDPRPALARYAATLSGGSLSVEILERGRGFSAWIDEARQRVRQQIARGFAPAAVGMGKALVLGENDLTRADSQAFQQSGLAHLLAVSGTHLVFAVLALVRALNAILVRVPWLTRRFDVQRWASLFGAVAALVYADFAGGSGSAWRAAWMLGVGLGARSLGGLPRVWRAVAGSVLIGWFSDPLIAFDISFLLSLAATLGLVALGRPCLTRFKVSTWGRRATRVERLLLDSIVATVCALLPCVPLLALLAPTITLAGIVANVLAAPVGETVALPLCLTYGFLPDWPALQRGVALTASGALLVVKRLAHETAAQTWLAVPLPPPNAWHLLVLGLASVGILHAGRGSARRFAAWPAWLVGAMSSLGLIEWGSVRAGNPQGQLRVTALDVGQGDGLLVDLPSGALMLVDAGGFVGSPTDPGQRVVAPVLRARRRHHVDIVVLSHPHPDHFGGLASALEHVSVGEFWDTGQGRRQGAGPVYRDLMAMLSARAIPMVDPSELCGPFNRFGARFDVLSPCPGFRDSWDANDNSWVIRVQHGRRAVLLTGDAEAHAEQHLTRDEAGRQRLRADFLKVGHHGSRTSTSPQLLAAVAPSWATISCGLRNRFGHPHAVTLDNLSSAGVRWFRLDRAGSVMWQTDGSAQRLRVFDRTESLLRRSGDPM